MCSSDLVTIANGANSATVAVGSAYDSKPVLVSVVSDGTAFAAGMFALIGIVAAGTLTVKIINPSTGAAVNCNLAAGCKVAYLIGA